MNNKQDKPNKNAERLNESIEQLENVRSEREAELERKLNIYRSAIDEIGILGHIDIEGRFEWAFTEVLKIASDAYVESGDYDEE